MKAQPRPDLESARQRFERWVNGRGPLTSWSENLVRAAIGATDACETTALSISPSLVGAPSEEFELRRRTYDSLRDSLTAEPLPKGAHAVLHGSFATGTLTAFSDVDIILIIDESLDARSLSRLKKSCHGLLRVMYRTAPLAHHGLNVIFRGEFGRYDQSLLPLAALEQGVHLSDEALRLNVRWDRELSRKSACARFTTQLSASRRNFESHPALLYRRHSAVSVLLLLPSLLLESVDGVYPYKRESYPQAKPRFRADEWSAIDLATEIRRQWSLPAHLYRMAQALNSSSSILSPEAGRVVVAASSWAIARTWDDTLSRSAVRFIDRCEELLHASR